MSLGKPFFRESASSCWNFPPNRRMEFCRCFRPRLRRLLACSICSLLLPTFCILGGAFTIADPNVCFGSNLTPEEPAREAVHLEQNSVVSLQTHLADLADPSYAKRMDARAAIIAQGVGALEHLHLASFSEDPQIASAARFLLKSNSFAWESDLDPRRVKEILQRYSDSEAATKQVHVKELARLESQEGLTALCRIARYEPDSSVAKLAALMILSCPLQEGQAKAELAARVLPLVSDGGNTSSLWLRQYFGASALENNWWEAQVRAELDSVRNVPTQQQSLASVEFALSFSMWVIEKVVSEGNDRQLAISLGARVLELFGNHDLASPLSYSSQMEGLCESFSPWALDAGLHELVDLQYSSLDELTIGRIPMYAYLVAESLQLQGKESEAQKFADSAFRREFLQIDGAPLGASSPESKAQNREIKSDADRRTAAVTAQSLRKRGKFDWAIRELELAAKDPVTSPIQLRAIYEIATIHHSLEDSVAAKAALEPLVERLKREPMFQAQMQFDGNMVGTLLSSYHQYCGDVERAQGDHVKAASSYNQAFSISPENVDALIAIHGLELSDADKATARGQLVRKVAELREYISKLEEFLKLRNDLHFAGDRIELAIQLNSLAWLIANTEGDFVQAIAFSKRACKLAPESPEFLDTLSHAYFANGEVTRAVEIQRQAIKMMPHVPEFQRALAKFEAKLPPSNLN